MNTTLSFGQAFATEEHHPFYYPADSNKACLLVHGFPGTPAEMRPIADYIHQRGWATKGILLPGLGHQIDNITEYTYQDWVSAVTAGLNELRQRYDFVMVIGHSMGGALSMNAITEAGADAAILSAPFWRVDHFLWKTVPLLKHILPTFKPFKLMKPDFSDPEFRDGVTRFMPHIDLDDPEIRQGILNFEIPLSLIDQIRSTGHLSGENAPRVNSPTLILQGTADELVKPEITRDLIKRFKNGVTYKEIDSGTHNLLGADTHYWPHVITAIDDFLAYLNH